MGIVRSAVRSSVGGATSLATPEKWIVDWFRGGDTTTSGIRVDSSTAMEWSPFFAGVRNLSEDLGSLPLPLYERLERGKRRATEHPLYALLHDAPNELMGAMTFRETLQGHIETWGAGSAFIEWNGAGRILSMWPLRPDRLKREVIPGKKGRVRVRYRYEDPVNGIHAALLDDEVLYIPNFGFDGVRGYSTIAKAREAIGLGLATELHGATFFGNGARPSAVLTHPDAVSDPARKRIRADWEKLHRGLTKSQRIAILEEGVKYEAIGIPNEDAQFLETRKFQVNEAARWLRMPPHKLGDLERATFSNIEHQSLEYVIDSIRPRAVRWEQAIWLQLLTARERQRYFAEHLVDGLLRGDIKTRYEAYAIGRQWGWESVNDVLEKENRNPIDGGDVYMVPLNMIPVDQLSANDDARDLARLALRGHDGQRRLGDAFAPMIEDLDRRIAKMERTDVRKLVERHLRARSVSAFVADLGELYEGTLRERMTDRWLPVFFTFAAEIAQAVAADVGYEDEVDLSRWVRSYVSGHIAYRVGSALGQLTKAVNEADDPAAAVLGRLDAWVEDRPAKTARWEVTQMRNAATRETWKVAGIRRMRWVTNGDNCPFCRDLDGVVVGIDEPFMPAGATAAPTGLETKLEISRNTFHPPLHPGCDCSLVVG